MMSLYLRNLFFTILQPGVVAVLGPYLILQKWPAESAGLWQHIAGGFIGALGMVVMSACILRFATEGKGTLSPADPTQQLVIKGLYRYSRNPMYIGVLGILVGEAVYFGSWPLGVYTLFIFGLFYLFVRTIEEPRLRRDFGESYAGYCKRVRRWV